MKAAVWFLLGLLLIVLLLFARQIMPHVGAGNPLIRLCRFVGPPLIEAWRREYNEERPKKVLGGLIRTAYAKQLATKSTTVATGL